ncbi:MAG TPA: ABC transporter ATP-binding protein [Pseudogracilibacillus sp.]|nr:ABC transporter ATP-binding protein [Pseudogracilibacillus sp.]
MKLILSFLKRFRLAIIVAYSLTFIELVTELMFPFLLGKLINHGIMNEDIEVITQLGILMFILTIISFVAGIVNSYLSAHISVSSSYDIREQLFERVQAFTFTQLSKYPTANLVTHFTNDVRQIQNVIFMGLRIMVRAPFMVIGSVIMAFIVNAKISLIFLITVPILIVFLSYVLKKGSKMFGKVQKNVDAVNKVIQENIAGMRVIKAFVRRDHEYDRFESANKQLARETEKAFRFMEAAMPILMLVMNVSLAIILYVGNMQVQLGATTVGDVVAIINYALRTVMAISMFTFLTLAFARATSSAKRIAPILEEEIITENKDGKTTFDGKISFDDVSFSYPNTSTNVLEDISFTIQAKETIAILGGTGTGKTTLFQLIPALYEPTAGNIFIDDLAIADYDKRALREQIGYVSQTPLLFSGTIKDNIIFGKEKITTEELIETAKDAQIYDTITSFPNGFDTVVGQKGVNLSGGQKQRLSIARALIRKPKILMLDDSTSALDVQTEDALLKALKKYDCTTLIITQKIMTAKQADRILLMDDGKVLDFGSHDTLLKRSNLYAEIVATQSE